MAAAKRPSAKKRPSGGAKQKPAAAPPEPPQPKVDIDRLDRGLVALAEIARPHGIAGELRLKVYNLDSDLLSRRPKVLLVLPDGTQREIAITAAREVDKALLVRLSGVDDRNAAEALRGGVICVKRDALPPPEEGEFYAHDIQGARAVLGSDEVGRVSGLASYPTCEVILVDRPGKTRLEVPLTDAYVARVDVKEGVVELVTLDGLD